jgi:signal transduction histidine kinase
MNSLLRKNFIYLTVALITILLAVDIVMTYQNNTIIEHNRVVREDAVKAEMYFDQIGRSLIHSLDIGLRGYAIVPESSFSAPMFNAEVWRDSIIQNATEPLKRLNYNFARFDVFKDSLDVYVSYCYQMKRLLDSGDRSGFLKLFSQDKGARLWGHYIDTENDVHRYLDNIETQSYQQYHSALLRNTLLHMLIFCIAVPTLLYTAYHTKKNFELSELLSSSEIEKNRFLSEQNALLEQKVNERTQEITIQNREISSQSEELATQRDTLLLQNKQLQEARAVIEKQNEEIIAMNLHLKQQVDNRTLQVQEVNQELVEQNTQLEQFAFIAAHNLRAPLARILGLTNLIKTSSAEEDKNHAFDKLVESTRDLDHVIKDLTGILNIKKHTSELIEVNMKESFRRVLRMLEKDIEDTQTLISYDFSDANIAVAVPPYVESILYNLVSNAIKYRNPEQTPVIGVSTKIDGDFICLKVSDNGLGIDLSKYRASMFNLYKRFHLHMEGKGLGLFLVKTQIESMGGRVEVESELNKGTSFLVYFRGNLA